MRTKNAKRLWPVPATLAVMALAALLAFGLMATTGAQPAAAQDADCLVTIATEDEGETEDGVTIAGDVDCSAMGDTATIKFTGPGGNPEDAEDIEVYVLVQDDKGDLGFYMNDVFWRSDDQTGGDEREKGTFYSGTSGTTEAKPIRYSEQNVTVPRAKRQGARWVAQSTTITVQGEGTVHVFLPDENAVDIVANFDDVDCQPNCDGFVDVDPPKALKFAPNQPGMDSSTVTIIFLGPPSIGKDSDKDRNKIIDDFQQCLEGTDEEFATATDDKNGVMGNCTPDGNSDDVVDPDDDPANATVDNRTNVESRSKLLGIVGADITSPINADDVTAVIDGKSAEIELVDDSQNSATVFVVLKDADGDALDDTDVVFDISSEPSNVFTSSRTVGTELVVANDDDEDNVAGIEGGNAIAMRVIDNLPTDHGYRVTIEVSSAGVDIGTMVITRHGTPETLKAATFNGACLDDVGEDADKNPDYEPAMVDLEKKDCAMQTRFGVGDVIVVKSHLEDSLGTVTAGDIEVDLADDFDDPLDTDGEDQLDRAVAANANPVAFVYVVDEDAMLGDHMITVSTDEDDVDDVTLTVQVAGPPDSYSIAGDSHIALNGSTTFTVTAVDEEMGIPAFTMDDTSTANEDESNDKVQVFIQGLLAGNIRGLDSNNMLKLDVETGMGSFTVYAPPAASQGHVIRIFVATGDMEVMHSAMFGMAPTAIMPPMELGAPSITSVMSDADGMATVMLMPGDNATKHYIWAQPTDLSQGMYSDEAAGDATMVTFSGLTSGMNYWFISIAGRGTGTDSEWSAWSGWTAEKSIQ